MQVSTYLPRIVGILIPILCPIAYIAILFYWWSEYNRQVDHELCSCSCWDTVFKGTYESGSLTTYKHFYFNATSNMAKIWILIVISVVAIYECVKYLIGLIIARSIRYSMLFLLSIIAFTHYYAWWMYVNYYNDEFYSQWNHQTFFTLTELLSTGVVLHLADSRNAVSSRKVLCVIGMGILHIIASGFDQFVVNVLKGEGMLHQKIRDMLLMVPDIFHVIVPLWLYYSTRREIHYTKLFHRDQNLQQDLIGTIVIFVILLMILYNL